MYNVIGGACVVLGLKKSLLVQAENDDGDLAEMRDGVIRGLGLSDEDRAREIFSRPAKFSETDKSWARGILAE